MGIFGNTFGLPHLIIILVIILLLFGAPKLPGLARSIGQSMKIFRNEVGADKNGADKKKADDDSVEPTASTEAPVTKPSKTEL